MKRVLLVATAIVVAAAAYGQDHLTPEPGPLADEGEYYVKVREVFRELFRDVLLEVVFFRAPEPEEMAGIRKTESGFEAFASKPSSYIWETYRIFDAERQTQGQPLQPDSPLAEMKRQFPSDFRQITLHTDRRTISASLTERIRRVWEDMLLNARHPKDPPVGTDGETYNFSMWVYQHGMVSGEVWSPRKGKTVAFTRLADALAEYARGKVDEKKLAQLVKPLER